MERRLAAILIADVVGYSRLMQMDEAGTLSALKARCTETLQPWVTKYQGRIVKRMGDGVLVEFGSAVNAVQCAVELQRAMDAANADLQENRRVVLRVGVSLGEIVAEAADIYGDGVNLAARLEALANPGSVVVSQPVFAQVRGKVELEFDDLGEQTLKNMAEPVRAYSVRAKLGGSRAGASSVTPPSRPSIAVLPFTNISGDPEQEYFSDGITEDLITALARFRSLVVIARNSSFAFKGRASDVKEVGRKLGVRYVIEGSVRKVGTRVRVTAQLIDTETGGHLWADRYDRSLDDIFAVQDEVVEQVTWRVAGKVSQTEITSARRRSTKNMDAYDLYLTALGHTYRMSGEDGAKAVALLERAIELDPNFGRAYSALARAHMVVGAATDSLEHYQVGIAAGTKAIELDDADESTHADIGHLYNMLHRPDEAKLHLDRAIALNPNNPMTVYLAAYDRLYRGQHQDALIWFNRARQLDPMDPPWVDEGLGATYYLLGRYSDALQAFTRMGLRWASHHVRFAAALAEAGRLDEARHHVAEARRLHPGYSQMDFAKKPFQPPDMENWLQGLRKAGLPDK
jgi:adenylate cyclase